MAIEDAWVISTALTSAQEVSASLKKYAQERHQRVLEVTRLSSRNLNLYEAASVPALARNSLLKVIGILPATLMLSQLDWLFNWRAD